MQPTENERCVCRHEFYPCAKHGDPLAQQAQSVEIGERMSDPVYVAFNDEIDKAAEKHYAAWPRGNEKVAAWANFAEGANWERDRHPSVTRERVARFLACLEAYGADAAQASEIPYLRHIWDMWPRETHDRWLVRADAMLAFFGYPEVK